MNRFIDLFFIISTGSLSFLTLMVFSGLAHQIIPAVPYPSIKSLYGVGIIGIISGFICSFLELNEKVKEKQTKAERRNKWQFRLVTISMMAIFIGIYFFHHLIKSDGGGPLLTWMSLGPILTGLILLTLIGMWVVLTSYPSLHPNRLYRGGALD